jgi:hypothetical protein
MNGFAKFNSAFERIEYPSWLGNQTMGFCRQSDGKGKVSWTSAPAPQEIRADEIYNFRLPVGLGYMSDKSGKFSLSLNGKAVLDFNVTLSDAIWKSKDGAVSMRYQAMENNVEDSNGVLTISVRGELLKAGERATFEVTGSAANSQRWFGIYLVPESRTAQAN